MERVGSYLSYLIKKRTTKLLIGGLMLLLVIGFAYCGTVKKSQPSSDETMMVQPRIELFENTAYPKMRIIKCWNDAVSSKCYIQDINTLECYLVLEREKAVGLTTVSCNQVLREMQKTKAE